MPELIHFDARRAEPGQLVEILDRDAALILDHALAGTQIDAILSEVEPFIAGTKPFDDDFVGRLTTRTGGLVARSKTAREAVHHPVVLGVADVFLGRASRLARLLLAGESIGGGDRHDPAGGGARGQGAEQRTETLLNGGAQSCRQACRPDP